MSGCTTRAAGIATDDPPRPHAEPLSWREDWRAPGGTLPAIPGARSTSRPAYRSGHRFFGAVLLDAHLRTQGQQPDLRAAAAVVAAPGTVGQCATRAALSGFPLPPLPVEQRLLCRVCEPRHGAIMCRGRLRLRAPALPGSGPALCHHRLYHADPGGRHLQLGLARVLWAPHLPIGPQPVSPLTGTLRLSGPAHDRMELTNGGLDARDAPAGRPLFLHAARLPGGHDADRPQGLIAYRKTHSIFSPYAAGVRNVCGRRCLKRTIRCHQVVYLPLQPDESGGVERALHG